MNKYKLYITLSVSILIAVIIGCSDNNIEEPEVSCDGVAAISFIDDIKPIIEAKCAIVGDGGCHNGGNGPDLNWTVFANFQERGADGTLQDRITRASGADGKMPKIGELSDHELQALYCWAEQGAQNN